MLMMEFPNKTSRCTNLSKFLLHLIFIVTYYISSDRESGCHPSLLAKRRCLERPLISCNNLRFRLCLVLAFLMAMSKTACQNSIWIKFGDCSKNAILGSRTHFSFFFLLLKRFQLSRF